MSDHDNRQNRMASSQPAPAESSAGGDSSLAQRIWQRYGGSPGVIATAASLALYRHIHSWSTGRLGLLADVYRRWTPATSVLPTRPAALVYTWSPVFTGAPSDA